MPSNIERKARRKRQTRLTFEPVDQSSSPAHISPAKVRYQLPGGMTPLSSVPIHNLEEGSADELSMSNSNTSTAGKRIQKVLFKALPTPAKSSQVPGKGSFDDDEDEDDQFESPLKRRTGSNLSASRGKPFGRTIISIIDSSDGSPPEDEVVTPSKRKRSSRKDKEAKALGYDSEQSSGDNFDTTISSRAARSSASQPTASARARTQKLITLSDDSEDTLSLPPQSTRGKPTPKSVKNHDDDEDFDIQPSSSRRGPRKLTVVDDDEEEEDEDSDQLPIVVNPKPARASRPAKQLVELGDDFGEESEDEEPVTSPLKRPRLAIQDSDDSDVVSSPLKRRRRVLERGKDDDSAENLPSPSILISRSKQTSSSSKGPTTPSRVTRQQKPKRHRTEKEKTMELLKRKRAGEMITTLTDSESDEDELQGAIYDTDEDMKALSEFEDEEESPEQVQRPKAKPRPRSVNSEADTEDHFDSDFVVEDDEGMLGVPEVGLHDIPLQFTHNAHKPLKEHFKDAVEWMVHNKINPAFERNDPVYRQAFNKLNDEYDALAKKFVSTQWTNEFTKGINARPIFVHRDIARGEGQTIDGEDKCDACNHRRHVPKFVISFNGKAYNKGSLEDIEEDSDSDSEDEAGDDDDEDEHISVDENGHDIPPESKEWFSGSFCFRNALQAHTLIHWRHSLNSWVLDALSQSNLLTPAQLASRDRLSTKKRTEAANDVVDRWEAGGELKSLYRDFKNQLDAARESMNGPGSGKWRGRRFNG